MLDLALTLLALGPVVLALLAAVAPPKAAWIRPALLPAVVAQLALAGALAVNQFLFGFLAGGTPPRRLSQAEIDRFLNATTGYGLPFTLAFAAALTALAAAVAFGRTRGRLHALPWVAVAAGAWCADAAQRAVLATVAEQPLGGRVDLATLLPEVHAAWTPWAWPAVLGFALAFPLFAWLGWWRRGRWVQAVLPGMLLLFVGAASPFAASSYTDGAWWGGRMPLEPSSTLMLETHNAIMMSQSLVLLAGGLSAVIALGLLLQARRMRVQAGRAMLRALGWFPLALALLWCQFVLASRLGAGVLQPGEQFTAVDQSLRDALPVAAWAAVLAVLVISAAGPRQRPAPSAPPSAAA